MDRFLELGARRVVGTEIDPARIEAARKRFRGRENRAAVLDVGGGGGLTDVVDGECFERIVSHNSFEHLPDPAVALEDWAKVLDRNGFVIIVFGPTWFSPYGGHLHEISRVPWLHLFFRESTIRGVLSRYPADGRPYLEIPINRMSIRRFFHFVEQSPLRLAAYRLQPIRFTRWFARLPLLSELFHSVVYAILMHREGSTDGPTALFGALSRERRGWRSCG